KKRKKRGSFTIAFKKKVLQALEESNNVSQTAKKFEIERQTIYGWKRQKYDIEKVTQDRTLSIRKRRSVLQTDEKKRKRAKYEELELKLIEWFTNIAKPAGMQISVEIWQRRAICLFKDVYPEKDQSEFKASHGWLDRFLRRHNLVNRAVTTIGQGIPSNASDLLECFYRYMDKLFENNKSKPEFVANMDETPVYFSMPAKRTFDFSGVKTVYCKTTGMYSLVMKN
ncbi:pogo transposable element with KRAB domain-like protein, partial [Leptotrombidium deliense]